MNLCNSKLGWILLIVAIFGDFAVAYVLGFYYTGYSHMKQVMSALGSPRSPIAIFYNSWLIILGILICISAVNFYNTYNEVSRGYAYSGLIILLVFGIGAGIIAGIFSVNEGKEIETLASKIHGIGAGIGFLALAFIPLIVGVLSFKASDNMTGIISVIFFILSIAFFVLFIMSEKDVFKNTGNWAKWTLATITIGKYVYAIIIDSTKAHYVRSYLIEGLLESSVEDII
ncbi:Protein of unknown function [Anaerovirgula multivorans]|uniref:DUF998 domain-containing protein n=1 Tax=Anaerovirgula multivorans TaxID=312168 RepID=A0A239GU68_9FIRM|nr:DUF998 domain-containing protein [Anaerovirgula multivorans]SNS72053.1 Protein of unknown function [Anaerovirgula multivorans]